MVNENNSVGIVRVTARRPEFLLDFDDGLLFFYGVVSYL